MAKNSSSGKRRATGASGGRQHRFIEYTLSDSDKEVLREEHSESDVATFDVVDELVAEGYKFSLSFSESSACYIASLTDKRVGTHFSNTTVSARGSSAANARLALLYRHVVLAQGDWNVLDSGKDTPADDFG